MTPDWTRPVHAWVWQARVVRVVDGDTLDIELDAGFRSVRSERLRLWGINAPETRGVTRAAGMDAKAETVLWCASAMEGAPSWPFLVETRKETDSFGRYLGVVWRSDGACLNHHLLSTGHAVEDFR